MFLKFHFVFSLFLLSIHEQLYCHGLQSCAEYRLKVNVAHVLNPREVTGGGGQVKPNIQFVGPFVYDVRITKGVVRQNSNETLTFTYKKSYVFNADESVANENDAYFQVPSVPYLNLVNSKEDPKYIEEILEATNGSQPFVLVTVKDFLWGYEDPILKTLHAKGRSNTTKFGIFLDDEEINGQTLTVSAGAIVTDGLIGDEYDKVERINGEPSLLYWESGMGCNEIQGTDFMDPSVRIVPNRTEKGYDSVYFLSAKACKPIEFSFKQEETDEDGHEILKFQAAPGTLSSDMKCYCRNATQCPKIGSLDLFVCKPGVTLSWLNFAHADPSILAQHEPSVVQEANSPSFLEVVKATGKVESLELSLQYNTWMRNVKEVPATANFPDILLPIVQTTDSIIPLDESEDDDGDTNDLQADSPQTAELKKEAKKVVKHVINAKLNKKHKKHKGSAGGLLPQSSTVWAMIIIATVVFRH